MNNFQQQTFAAARPGFHPQGMMGGPGMQQHPRMMGNPQQQMQGMMGQQGMMGGPQHRMAGPGMHPQGMMGAQQHRMGMPGQQGMMGAQHPMVSPQGMMRGQQQRMAAPMVNQQGMMGAQRPMVSHQGMMGAQRPVVSQQGMMGAQRPVVSQQGMMGAQRPVVSQQGMMGTQRPMVSQQGMMGAQRPVVSQQGMMGAQRPVVNQQGMMGAQHPRMTGPRVCQPGMMGNQQLGMMGNQQPGMMGNQQPGMIGNQQQRMPGVSQQSMMGPRVNQQLMMRGQQQRMMGHAVSQQSMMGMQQQRMMGVNQQQRSVRPGQMQQGMMGAHQHGPNFPQQSMMGTTGAQQQRIMVTILPEHGAVGPAGSQRIVESTHSVSERQVIEINTSSDVSVMDRKQNGATARSNNVNIVISPQEDMPRYDAPNSTANTSVSPRASTLRTLVEVPLSFDTEVSSEKQKYTKDVDHRLLKPDLDPGVLKDGDVDYRTLVPIRPAEENDTTVPHTTPDKSSGTKDIPLKLLVKLKPLKPLQKAQPPGETVKTEPKTESENSSPTKDDKEPSKPGLVPVPSKGSANKSKITLKLIDRTAKQKRPEQNSILSGIPNLLENSVQRLSLSMEPTQQEILSALEEDCGCLAPLSSAVDENMTEGTPEVSDINKSINLKWPVSALSTEDRMETVQVEDVGSKVYSSQREESGMSTSPEEVVISELPTTKSETVADSGNLSLVSGEEATEISERHNSEQEQGESEDILQGNRPFLNHSKGPLKSFSLQDKEERQARDDELIQASLDAMVEPSEVQNIAVSFRNPIAEAFEPNKPGSPLLSLALKLTRLHKRNVTKSYNGRHLRRTISMIEEGMEAHKSSDTELQQQKNKRELRLVICRVFARSGESQPELKECPATRDASEKSQDTRTVIVSEEAIKKEDAMLPSCFQDTKERGDIDCENFTPLNNNLPGEKETQHSKNDNLVESSTSTSPKRKAFDDVDPPLPRKVARSNSPAVCSDAKLGTVQVKQEGGTITTLPNSTRNLFNTLSRSTNSQTDLQSRNSNNGNSHSAWSGEFSNISLKLQSLSSSIDVSTVDNPKTSTQNSQSSVSRSSEGSEIKGQCNKCNKPIKANSKTDRTKSLVKEEKLQCDIQGDCTFNTGATASNYNDLPCRKIQENSKKGSQEARFKNQAEDVGSSLVHKVEENQNSHSTCRQSSQRLCFPRIDSTVKTYPVVGASHFAQKSPALQSNSKPLNCHDQSYRADSEHTDLNSPVTESKGRYNSLKNASGTLQNENGDPRNISMTLNVPKVPSLSQQTTKTVQNLPKESQSHQKAYSSQSIPVILGREASESQTTKTAVPPGTSPHAKTFPSQKDEQHKSPKAQGKFFRVCQPPCKLKEGSTAFKLLQEESKNGVQGEVVVKQEEFKMEASEEREGTTNSDVRKVEFSKTDVNQEDPSKWPQGISLQAMKHVILVDLDCWPQFFQSLPKGLVEDTFVWGFQDAKTLWRPPVSCEEYCRLGRKRHFYLHPPCASADSAICMVAGKLDSYLPRHLPFTILSGLQGFTQLQHRWNRCKRKANLVDPNTTDLHNLLHHIFYTQDTSRSMS